MSNKELLIIPPKSIMKLETFRVIILILFLSFNNVLNSQPYPDQHYSLRIDSIYYNIESSGGIKLSNDSTCIMLQEGVTDGYLILKPQHSNFLFNHGLPSWNGTAPDSNSSFKIQMHFPYSSSWSPWLTVGFWKSNIWSTYGTTSYGGGLIDYDYVKLNSYINS